MTSYTSQTTSITPVPQKEPEGMEENLSVVFQVSKFKYITLSVSIIVLLTTLQGRKKRDLSQKIILGEGRGEDGGTLRMFYLWENCKLP